MLLLLSQETLFTHPVLCLFLLYWTTEAVVHPRYIIVECATEPERSMTGLCVRIFLLISLRGRSSTRHQARTAPDYSSTAGMLDYVSFGQMIAELLTALLCIPVQQVRSSCCELANLRDDDRQTVLRTTAICPTSTILAAIIRFFRNHMSESEPSSSSTITTPHTLHMIPDLFTHTTKAGST